MHFVCRWYKVVNLIRDKYKSRKYGGGSSHIFAKNSVYAML